MNTKAQRSNKASGFTLVELLIVVIILAILAAIVVPQFSGSTDDAKLSALDSNLAAMRSAIALYRQQHGTLPGASTSVPTLACTGTKGTGDASTPALREVAFLDQMAYYTSADGQACSIKETGFIFGPYLAKRELPSNPYTDTGALDIVTTGDLEMTSASTTGGWKFDATSGKFIADHSSYDER